MRLGGQINLNWRGLRDGVTGRRCARGDASVQGVQLRCFGANPPGAQALMGEQGCPLRHRLKDAG